MALLTKLCHIMPMKSNKYKTMFNRIKIQQYTCRISYSWL